MSFYYLLKYNKFSAFFYFVVSKNINLFPINHFVQNIVFISKENQNYAKILTFSYNKNFGYLSFQKMYFFIVNSWKMLLHDYDLSDFAI